MMMFFFLVFWGSATWSRVAEISSLRLSVEQDKVRLVLMATDALSYTTTLLPKSLVVDIKQAKFKAVFDNQVFAATPIATLESKPKGKDLHLVMRLKTPVVVKHFFLSRPHRLVLDFYLPKKPHLDRETSSSTPSSDHATDSSVILDDLEQDLIAKLYQTNEKSVKDTHLRQIVVVIDPGHGGKDPGAIGKRGTCEKDVTLAIAKALQRIMNNTRGFRAVLTRSQDYFIPLRERLEIAHSCKADVFISIHADAYRNRDAHGISIFALSQRGATSEAARWLAEKENESELGQAISDKGALLRSVLIDLAQTATIGASLEIGGKILSELSNFTSLHFKEVEQAAFVVLKSPDIPSLLVETGFLSYRAEELKLRNANYQREIASRLAAGIQTYFIRHPPLDSYLAKMRLKINSNPKSATLAGSLPDGD